MKLAVPAFPLDVINRTLAREASLREPLAAHAGKRFTVASGAVHASFVIAADGQLTFPGADAPPVALTLTIPAADIAPLLADPAQFATRVQCEGDAALAATLADLAHTGPWFVERALASAFGAVAGQRLADAGRDALALPAQAGQRLRDNITSFLRDESGLAVPAAEATANATDVAALSARVEALLARVAALEGAPNQRPAG